MQLVATGPQDAVLIGNPQITFFKMAYRRHTNFSMETMEVEFDGMNLDFGRRATCTIPRLGDLLHRAVLKFKLPPLTTVTQQWVHDVGLAMIEEVEINIGGKRIDRHLGEWLFIWSELSLDVDQRLAFKAMVNGFNKNTGQSTYNQKERTVMVPLAFWFNRSTAMALPLVAMAFHEVKLVVKLRPLECLAREGKTLPTNASLVQATVLLDYIYLDENERHRFSQSPHELLIDQLQFNGSMFTDYPSAYNMLPIDFKHPIKELVWVVRHNDVIQTGMSLTDNHVNDWFNFNEPLSMLPLVRSTKIMFNNNERVAITFPEYYTVLQPYFHHRRAPIVEDTGRYLTPGINVYSFALRPEDYQPSGSMNFSRLNSASLNLEMDPSAATAACEVFIFGVTYNVLRIQNGMAGIAFY